MSKVLVNESSLTDIANAIRAKNGTETTYKPSEMAAAIEAIPTGSGGNPDDRLNELLTRTITEYSNDNLRTVEDYSFIHCRQLKTVNIPNATGIQQAAFEMCESMTSINCANVTYLEKNAFSQCNMLTEIYLPKLTSATNASMMFYNCYSLVRAELGSCDKLAMYAFYGCSAIEAIILRKTDAICTIHKSAFYSGDAITKGTGYVYVPAALVDTYRADSVWSTYAAQLRAIEDYPDICGEE